MWSIAEWLLLPAQAAPAMVQERRLRCKQYPKRSTIAAEIETVHQEIDALQSETDQAMHQYEVIQLSHPGIDKFCNSQQVMYCLARAMADDVLAAGAWKTICCLGKICG